MKSRETVIFDNNIPGDPPAQSVPLRVCTGLSSERQNKEFLLTSNKKFAVSAIFLGISLFASPRPCRAQAELPQRSTDAPVSDQPVSNSGAPDLTLPDKPTAPDALPAAPALSAAATPGAAAAGAPAASTAPESNWHLSITPYLWFPGAHGNIGDPNGGEIGFSASPGDLLSKFRFGIMGAVEPRYKRIVMPLDIFYIRLGDDKALPNSPNQGVANLKAQEFLVTQKIGYRVIDSERLKIDGLAGFRYWHYGEQLSFTTNDLNFSGSQNWVDPLVGGRIIGILTPKIEVNIGGDVGGWGAAAQMDYQIFGALGYRIKPALALQVGYRYLYFDYRKVSGVYFDTATSGLFFGVTIDLK